VPGGGHVNDERKSHVNDASGHVKVPRGLPSGILTLTTQTNKKQKWAKTMTTKNKPQFKNKKSPRKANPIAKYGPRVNKPKIIQGKKFPGPNQEEWK
jgi:hypothetical protein